MRSDPVNLFYAEPDPDRWLPYDRYPRRVVRRIVRGPSQPGGQTRVFLHLMQGLDRLGIPYRANDYRFIRRNPHALACIIGKPFVLDRMEWPNPILFGAAVTSHPSGDPALLTRRDIRRLLVPGPWCRDMFAEEYGSVVHSWPVGINTDLWTPTTGERDIDVLLYDKIRWRRDEMVPSLLDPVRQGLERRGLEVAEIRYGYYREEDFRALVARSRAMVFLCEHETQGIAYQQVLASGLPILAWDHGGEWMDPEYWPHRVRYAPVSSVPYWDDRCGLRFRDAAEFDAKLDDFMAGVRIRAFQPRSYILENLTLEKCAAEYVAHVEAVEQSLTTPPATDAPAPSGRP